MEEGVLNDQKQSIQELMNRITGDGRICKQDVIELKKFLQDGNGHFAMNQAKADMLVKLREYPSSKDKIDDSFQEVFIDAICSYLLQDKETAGVLDTIEIDWLNNNIVEKTDIDDVVIKLLEKLKEKSINYPVKFDAVKIKYELSAIVQKVFDDDKPDMRNCVKTLSDLLTEYNCSIVDRDCVGMLFEIKNLLKQKNVSIDNCFQKVYLDYIQAVLLKDAKSPRRIDKVETKWLEDKLLDQPEIDKIDKTLLKQLREKSMNFPEVLEKMHFEEWKKELLKNIDNKQCVRLKGNEVTEEDRSLDAFLAVKYSDYLLAERDKVEFLFDLKNLARKNNQVKECLSVDKDDKSFIKLFVDRVISFFKNSTEGKIFAIDEYDVQWLDGKFDEIECLDPDDIVILYSLKSQLLLFPTLLDERLSRLKLRQVIRDIRGIEDTKDRTLDFSYYFEENEPPQKVDKDDKDYEINHPDSDHCNCVNYIDNALFDIDGRLKIDSREAAEYLIQIKDLLFIPDKRPKPIKKWVRRIYSKTYDEKFSQLYINVLTSFLLDDKKSQGEIDPEEVKWLVTKINEKGGLDDYDVDLLDELKKKSINYPEILVNHIPLQQSIEWLLFHSRYMSLFAVFASMFGALVLFTKGVLNTGKACRTMFCNNSNSFIEVVESVDTFLVALVLIIFSLGIYELFIGKLDPKFKINEKTPYWMRISSIDDLKSSLVKVLLIAMIVGFYKKTLDPDIANSKNLSFLALGILLISGAFCLAEISAHFHKKNKEKKERKES